MGDVLPWVMIVLSFAASVVYFLIGDVRHGFYWMFAGCLNLSVTV